MLAPASSTEDLQYLERAAGLDIKLWTRRVSWTSCWGKAGVREQHFVGCTRFTGILRAALDEIRSQRADENAAGTEGRHQRCPVGSVNAPGPPVRGQDAGLVREVVPGGIRPVGRKVHARRPRTGGQLVREWCRVAVVPSTVDRRARDSGAVVARLGNRRWWRRERGGQEVGRQAGHTHAHADRYHRILSKPAPLNASSALFSLFSVDAALHHACCLYSAAGFPPG